MIVALRKLIKKCQTQVLLLLGCLAVATSGCNILASDGLPTSGSARTTDCHVATRGAQEQSSGEIKTHDEARATETQNPQVK
jgi:hypothetical protein